MHRLMRYVVLTPLLLAACWNSAGCVVPKGPEYRDVQLHSVELQTDRRGRSEVVVVKRPYIAFEEIIERSPNVSAVARVTTLDGKRQPVSFAVSPDGDSIIFDALELGDAGGYSNLWRIGARGTGGISRVTSGNYFDMDPCLSPDGSRVFFASTRNSSAAKIWSVRATGAGGIAMLTRGDGNDRRPSVSSADGRVFLQSLPEFASEPQIWSIAADGGLPTQLTEGEQPVVSPDGSLILFSKPDRDTGKRKIWVMGTDGIGRTQLTSGDSDDVHPAWSPDGSHIVFASDMARDSNGRKNYDIWLMNREAGALTQLTTNGSTDLQPRFSPDGRTVYFLSNRGFHWDLWQMDILQ